MNDDFNSPVVIAELFEAARIINSINDGKSTVNAEGLESLKSLMNDFVFNVLGLKEETAETDDLGKLVGFIIELRLEARANKDYATSDRIRNGLQELGIQLKDSKEGTSWSKI